MGITHAEQAASQTSFPQLSLLPRLLILKALHHLWKYEYINIFVLKEFTELPPEAQLYTKNLYRKLLRRCGQIDALIKNSAGPGFSNKNSYIVDVLRVVVAEFVFMKLPRNRALQLTEQLLQNVRYKNFLPIAMKIIKDLVGSFNPNFLTDSSFILNVPPWLFQKWHQKYGLGVAQQIALTMTQKPGCDFYVREDSEVFLEEVKGKKLTNQIVRCPAVGRVYASEFYKQGKCWELDWSVTTLAPFIDIKPGLKVLDLCAAPGMKAMYFMEKGAKVTLLDKGDEEFERLKKELERVKFKPEFMFHMDAMKWESSELYDLVLVDPPCSESGSLRHRPEKKYLLKEDDVLQHQLSQQKLLDVAYQFLKPGGMLLYTTNSLEEEENIDQVKRLLGLHKDLERIEFTKEETGQLSVFITEEKDLLLYPFALPEEGGCDSLFVSRLKKA